MFKRQVLSATWKVSECFIAMLRSLMKIKKSKGPRTLWNTKFYSFTIRVKIIDRNKLRSITQIGSETFEMPLTPSWSRFSSKLSWNAVSNTFSRSIKIPQGIFPSSSAFWMLSSKLKWHALFLFENQTVCNRGFVFPQESQ